MTGPTTAAELLLLAGQELGELTATTGTAQVTPAELAAAWPAFHRAGRHLLAAITTDPAAEELRRAPGPNGFAIGDLAPEPHLSRAADLLSAAADLLTARDRSLLTEADVRTDVAHATGPLLTGAYLVADATLRDPSQVDVAAGAVTAVRDWSAASSTSTGSGRTPHLRGDDRGGTLEDAHTLASASRRLPSPTSGVPDLPALLSDAVQDWRSAALAAGQLPTPSSHDLRGSARAAGTLLAMSQLLLRAYPDHTIPDARETQIALEATITRIQQAGKGWNVAADWGPFTTGTPADPALVTATSRLDQTISLLARSGGHWAPPTEIALRADGDKALTAARGALAAIQTVAEGHAMVVARVVQTAGLYAPAVALTPTIDRVSARIAHRWVPTTKTEGRTLTDSYSQLGDRTAAARLAYSHLTNPTRTPRQAGERFPTDLGTAHQHGPREAVPAASSQPETRATTVAGQRWQRTCQELDPRLLSDPHWLALAGALDRVELAGVDITATLALALADEALPEQHPARELHYRLVQVSSAAATPYTRAPAPALPPSRPSLPAPAAASPAVGRAQAPQR